MVLQTLTQEEVGAVRALGHVVQASRIALVVGIGIFVSDYVRTLPREIRFYWFGKYSIPRVLYFVIRYFNFPVQMLNAIGFFNPPSDTFCVAFVNAQLFLDLFVIWSVQAILVLRIRAAYGSEFLGNVLWAFLFLVIMSEAGLSFAGINVNTNWRAQPIPSVPNLRFCVPEQVGLLQRTHYLTWVPTLVFDSIIFILSLWKFIQFRQTAVPSVFKKSLMWTLLHDSIAYYALLLAVAVVYMVVARINVENGEPASNIIFPLISAAGCRLLFHIRSRDRAKCLGLDDTEFKDQNGSPMFSEELETSRPIEFMMFSGSTRRSGILSDLTDPDEFPDEFPDATWVEEPIAPPMASSASE